MSLITQENIHKKAMRFWNRGDICRAWLNEHDIFPLEIAFRKPNASEMSEHHMKIRDWIGMLRQHSKEQCGKGYHLEFKQVKNRKIGEQSMPSRIYFDCCDDLLSFTGKTKAFLTFKLRCQQTLTSFPCLQPWLRKYPLKLLEYAQAWSQLLLVCAWFSKHPRPKLYIRELDIEGVDSKFIEQHKGILSELLSILLPEESVDISISGLSQHGFERRFGLQYDEPLIRFRLLDIHAGFSDISVPISQFESYQTNIKTVFITENKINGLSFPNTPSAMVLFGLGYGIEILKDIAWIQDKRIIYWGDIDTHGFSILSQLRSYFPQVQSICMDEISLLAHKPLWGCEDKDKRYLHPLKHLNESEQNLFNSLKNNDLGISIRMEQERIRHTCLLQQLKELQC